MSFSPDGKLLATGHGDGAIVVWDPVSGEKVADVGRHRSSVYSVCFGNDNRQLLSCGDHDSCYLWDIPSTPLASDTKKDDGNSRDDPKEPE